MPNPCEVSPITIASIYEPQDDFFKSDKAIFVRQSYLSFDKITKRMSYKFIDEMQFRKIKFLGCNTSYVIGNEEVSVTLTRIRIIYNLIIYHIPSINVTIRKDIYSDEVFYMTITGQTDPNTNNVKFIIKAMTKVEFSGNPDPNTCVLSYLVADDLILDQYTIENTDEVVQTRPKFWDEHQLYTYRVFMHGVKLIENIDYKLNINIIPQYT